MKTGLFKWIAALGFLLSSLVIAAEIPIYFQTTTAPVAIFTPPAKSPLALANEAFLIKYGAENGVIGTSEGQQGSFIVWVSDMQIANYLWTKMVGAGDAYNTSNGGYFRYNDGNQPTQPLQGYQFAGRLQISGNTTEVLGVTGWVPPIKAFFVAMDNQCVFAKAAVYTQNNVPVQTTQLVKSYKYGPHAIAYEHLVNGGAGANLSGIAISLGSKQLAGFPLEICPVDIYVRH
jgi:hypothetical protein